MKTEWPASPVRTVTRKEIVPGIYGRIKVGHCSAVTVAIAVDNEHAYLDAGELRAAAATLAEIADAFEEAAK